MQGAALNGAVRTRDDCAGGILYLNFDVDTLLFNANELGETSQRKRKLPAFNRGTTLHPLRSELPAFGSALIHATAGFSGSRKGVCRGSEGAGRKQSQCKVNRAAAASRTL